MKLISLSIDGYKNLKNFNIKFSETPPYVHVIIGENGSGKSNLLEAISTIFAEFYESSIKANFTYEICYEINNKVVLIRKKNQIHCTVDEVERRTDYLLTQDLLPSHVISVYSGEELRMWETIYYPYYKKFVNNLIKGKVNTSNQKLTYINKYYWNIALLILILSDLDDNQKFIKKELKIDKTEKIQFVFDENKINKNKEPILKAFLDRIRHKNEYSLEELKTVILANEYEEMLLNEFDLFDKLVRAYIPKDFKTITSINNIFNNGLTVADLSEGEKKRLLIKFVLSVISDRNSLILLDEPDAFLHPKWQRELINFINSLQTGQTVLVTTHAPNVISDVENENVFSICDGSIIKSVHKTSGRDINAIQLEAMNTPIRNNKTKEKLDEIYELISENELDKAEKIVDDLAKNMGYNDLDIIKIKTMIDFEREFQ